jgi:hypothetical protein
MGILQSNKKGIIREDQNNDHKKQIVGNKEVVVD